MQSNHAVVFPKVNAHPERTIGRRIRQLRPAVHRSNRARPPDTADARGPEPRRGADVGPRSTALPEATARRYLSCRASIATFRVELAGSIHRRACSGSPARAAVDPDEPEAQAPKPR